MWSSTGGPVVQIAGSVSLAERLRIAATTLIDYADVARAMGVLLSDDFDLEVQVKRT